MSTLVLSTRSLPAAGALTEAARTLGWSYSAFDETPDYEARGKVVFYGGTDLAMVVASRYRLALLEPPFDLLARLPVDYRLRSVEFARFADLGRLSKPTFVKPADSLHKSFDAGVYSDVSDIRTPKSIDPDTPVLLSEAVEWSTECRCFIQDGQIAAWSPYISYGRKSWKPFGKGTPTLDTPPHLESFCKRLFSQSGIAFPPGFVVDLGMIDDRGWAVVEFNPAWCSGVLGADPKKVLNVLERASQASGDLNENDIRWVVERRTTV